VSALLADDRVYSIVDPQHHDDFVTSRGVLRAGESGWIRTRDKGLAQEIEAREPWALVVEHEREAADRAMRGRSMMRVPVLPWNQTVNSGHCETLKPEAWHDNT
jgi:hypothetical protein